MAWQDERLLEAVAYGFSGGPTFETTRVRLRSGHERRNAERLRPLYKYSAPFDQIDEVDHAAVLAAYVASLGPLDSFRFKDWSDYRLENVTIGVAIGGVDETMQIVKPYTFGITTVNRPITKPVDSTKYNKANGYAEDAVALAVTEDTGGGPVPLAFAVDYQTGVLTFTSSAGATIRVTGEFDVPVHFDDDALVFSFQNWRAHSTDIALVEDFGA
jgi:uncharacterized protein (TIGR02217 family)